MHLADLAAHPTIFVYCRFGTILKRFKKDLIFCSENT